MSEQTRRRMTAQTRSLLQAIVDHPAPPMYGYDLMRLSGLQSGTLYPALSRLEEQGYLSSRFEDIDPRKEGRSARRIYMLTTDGRRHAEQALSVNPQKPGLLKTLGLSHA